MHYFSIKQNGTITLFLLPHPIAFFYIRDGASAKEMSLGYGVVLVMHLDESLASSIFKNQITVLIIGIALNRKGRCTMEKNM